MHSSISRDDLQILLREADVAARRIVRQLRLPRADLDDFRQDLLVDLIARLKNFDPGRGSLGAFAGTVVAHRASRLAARIRRHRSLFAPVSLDDPLPGTEGATLGDTIAEDAGYAALMGQPVDAFAGVERRLDIGRGIGSLDPDDGALCAALSRTSVDRLAAAGRGSRSSLYRRMTEIRFALMAAGLQAA